MLNRPRDVFAKFEVDAARARFIDTGYSVGIAWRFCHREAHRHGNTSEISARIACDVYIIAGTTRSRHLRNEMIRIKRWHWARANLHSTLGNNKMSKETFPSLTHTWNNPAIERKLQIILIHYNLTYVRRMRDVFCGSIYARVMQEGYKARYKAVIKQFITYTVKLYASRGHIRFETWTISITDRFVSTNSKRISTRVKVIRFLRIYLHHIIIK